MLNAALKKQQKEMLLHSWHAVQDWLKGSVGILFECVFSNGIGERY